MTKLGRGKATVASPTLAARMDTTGGRSSGFDYMRLCLSVAVVCIHSVSVTGLNDADVFWNTPARPIFRIVLPMFFALSGFLVTGSMCRAKTTAGFLGLRVIRIYPALAVEALLSALILGPLVTSFTLPQYFSSPTLYNYLLNVIGDVHFLLPGVFATNPTANLVNYQLWTVPYELLCYIALALLSVIGVVRRRGLILGAIVLVTIGYVIARYIKYDGALPEAKAAVSGVLLLACFLSGVAIYLYKDLIRWSLPLFALSAIASVGLLGFVPQGETLVALPVAYVTVYLGLMNPRRHGLLQHADLSYGIFLYGYVVQQTIVYVFPWSHHWYLNIMLSMPCIILVAAASWHWVEKPALKLRRPLTRAEAWHVGWMARMAGRPASRRQAG